MAISSLVIQGQPAILQKMLEQAVSGGLVEDPAQVYLSLYPSPKLIKSGKFAVMLSPGEERPIEGQVTGAGRYGSGMQGEVLVTIFAQGSLDTAYQDRQWYEQRLRPLAYKACECFHGFIPTQAVPDDEDVESLSLPGDEPIVDESPEVRPSPVVRVLSITGPQFDESFSTGFNGRMFVLSQGPAFSKAFSSAFDRRTGYAFSNAFSGSFDAIPVIPPVVGPAFSNAFSSAFDALPPKTGHAFSKAFSAAFDAFPADPPPYTGKSFSKAFNCKQFAAICPDPIPPNPGGGGSEGTGKGPVMVQCPIWAKGNPRAARLEKSRNWGYVTLKFGYEYTRYCNTALPY